MPETLSTLIDTPRFQIMKRDRPGIIWNDTDSILQALKMCVRYAEVYMSDDFWIYDTWYSDSS